MGEIERVEGGGLGAWGLGLDRVVVVLRVRRPNFP